MNAATTSSTITGMSAETEFSVDESVAPLRWSGFVCLLFGFLSVTCLLGAPLLVVPLIGLTLGFIALRHSYGGVRPVGTSAAKIGMILATGFGICGLSLPVMKTRTLGAQAERFSRDYIEVVARGQLPIAIELGKMPIGRMSQEMSLDEHYRMNESASNSLKEFEDQEVNQMIIKRGPNAEWVLYKPARIYYSYGRHHADVVWSDPTGTQRVRLMMEYKYDYNGDPQWHCPTVMEDTEFVVSHSIL